MTNEKGVFLFPSLSSGQYIVRPYYKEHNIHFTPETVKFNVEHNSVILPQHFEVSGFSISGTVLNSMNGSPLKNAIVYVNGQEVGKTDGSGKYTLEKLKTGSYNISIVYGRNNIALSTQLRAC